MTERPPTASPASDIFSHRGQRSAAKPWCARFNAPMSSGPSKPAAIPVATTSSNSGTLCRLPGAAAKIGPTRLTWRTTVSAIAAANSNGPKLATLMPPSTISATNKAPAIGVLYAPASPAAAPQATAKRRSAGDRCRAFPNTPPDKAASCTIEPSRPIEPPEMTVAADAIDFSKEDRQGTSPPATMASI